MSLLDALFLDPQRINVWFAVRTDGNKGSGTQSDPYRHDVFDDNMNGLPANPPVCVHLGPGVYETKGYADDGSAAGWQPRPGMKIVGSGIDVTTVKLAGAQDPPSGTRHYWVVGHLVGTGGALMDYFEISDLTIDCDRSGQTGTHFAVGAVRIMGHHSRVRRVKAVGWGKKASGPSCQVIALITADPAFIGGPYVEAASVR